MRLGGARSLNPIQRMYDGHCSGMHKSSYDMNKVKEYNTLWLKASSLAHSLTELALAMDVQR